MPDPIQSAGGLARLVSKLPTWRGTMSFFYVAAHWKEISGHLETYRQQIADREGWAERALSEQEKLHEIIRQRITEESQLEVERMRQEVRRLTELAARQDVTIEQWSEAATQGMQELLDLAKWGRDGLSDCVMVVAELLHREDPPDSSTAPPLGQRPVGAQPHHERHREWFHSPSSIAWRSQPITVVPPLGSLFSQPERAALPLSDDFSG
jgi:hypothetical protein